MAPGAAGASPQAPRPVAPASAPQRGAGGLGRAVIAAPTPQTQRVVRAVQQAAAMPRVARPAPGAPAAGAFARPGFAPRPGPGGPPRPGFRGPAAPAIPPPLAPGADKRRKDAGKPGAPRKDDVKKAAGKKPRTKEASALEEDVREYLGTYKADTYEDIAATPVELDEAGNPIAQKLSKSAQRRAGRRTMSNDAGNVVQVSKAPSGPVFLSEGVTVKELSEKLGIMAKDLMKSLFARGLFATINQTVNPKLALDVAREFGVEAAVVSFEEELELSRQQSLADSVTVQKEGEAAAELSGDRIPRAPVVTVMGHVDHGKTSLLDAIRKANVAESEAGGITQHIGAYRVEIKGRMIVFLDTPGHEAFTMMRSRGAKATDIVVLVVAADDGVMPQTSEAIDHARAARVPIVVAINKIDKPEANTGRVKQELADKGVIVEEFGGEVVACEISAKKKIGIDQLLEMILLQADILELKAVPDVPARGVVLEARREAGKGTLATVLVQQGTLRVGDVFFAGAAVGRVRAMLDDHGNRINEAGPATPAEVMGFEDLPNAGDTLQVVEDEQKARQVSTFRSQKEREESLTKSSRMSLDSLFSRMSQGEAKDLALIVKADVHGSEEVLVQTLAKLSTEKVKVSVLHSGVGAISVNDVLLASASEAIIIGFNVRPERKAQELADKEGVDIRLYSVIYTLTDEIKKAMTGLLDKVKREVPRGKAEVRDTFKVPKVGTIAGCMVTDGSVPRSASVRLVRDSRVIYEGKIGSLRRFKDDASEVKSGFECGIGIAGYQDVKVGDVIEAFVIEEVAPSLS
jgi:translation initiation factor IF-2